MTDFCKQYLIHNIPFHVLTFLAVALLITSFFLPPTGEISPSVLQGVAEIFAFMALWTVIHAINTGKTARIKHKETELTISDKKEEDQ